MKIGKKKIILVIGILISVVSTWLFARHIEWGLLLTALKDANYIYIIPSIIVSLLVFVVRAIRWKSLISPIKKISFNTMFSAISIGFMANNILPARIGEIIRASFLGKKVNVKITSCFATVFLERIFDLFGLLVFTIVILILVPSPDSGEKLNVSNDNSVHASQTVEGVQSQAEKSDSKSFLQTLKKWIGVFAGVGVMAICALAFVVIYPNKMRWIFFKLFFVFPHRIRDKLMVLVDSFISGFQILENKWQVVWIFFLTIIVWILIAVSTYILSFSFNLGLPLTGACLVTISIAFAVALPQAPGYIGLFHLATQKTLEIFNIEIISSQSFAITLWAMSVIPITIIGILFLWKEGIGFKELTKMEKKGENA